MNGLKMKNTVKGLILILFFFVTHCLSAQVNQIYIREVMYDSPLEECCTSPQNHNNGEYLSLFNPTNQSINISGWIIMGNESPCFTFPAGSFIQAKANVVVYYQSNANFIFTDFYHIVPGTNLYPQSAVILSNRGETISLYDNNCNLIDFFTYTGNTHIYQEKWAFAKNFPETPYGKLKAYYRIRISLKDNRLISRGNEDLGWCFANPFAQGIATRNNEITLPPIPPEVPADTSLITNPVPGDNTFIPGEAPRLNNSYSNSSDKPPLGLGSITNTPHQEIKGGNLVQYSIADTAYTLPIVWFKTLPVTGNLNGYYSWIDVLKKATLKGYDKRGAKYGPSVMVSRDKVRAFNFNPAIDITLTDSIKEILISHSPLSQTTIMGIWGSNRGSVRTDRFLYSLNNKKDGSSLLTTSLVVAANNPNRDFKYSRQSKSLLFRSSESADSDESAFKESSLRIMTYNQALKGSHSVWGNSQESVLSIGGNFMNSDVNNTVQFSPKWDTIPSFKGFTPELLIFDRVLTVTEKSIYETYLAIKYGITLDNSYVSPTGTILWDKTGCSRYNRRVFGYGREDALSLYQKSAQTSYREAPFYTYNDENDSYDQGDSYKLSSRNHLITIGKENSCPIRNGEYIMSGDNGDSVKIINDTLSVFIKTLARRWMVMTNGQSYDSKVLNWKTDGLTITDNMNKLNFRKSDNKGVAYAVTTSPLKGEDGCLSWTLGTMHGPFIMKFGTELSVLTQGSNDYGYKVLTNGDVKPIIKGVVSENTVFKLKAGQRVEMEKNGSLFSLRINGVCYKCTEFSISESSDLKKSFYGSLFFDSNLSGSDVLDLRHGGFVDTGNKIELSFNKLFALDLYNLRRDDLYLIIDRSGEGSFTSEVYSQPVSEVDSIRNKFIFRNIFWDSDKNGKDVFTFGLKGPQTKSKSEFNIQKTAEEIKEDIVMIYQNNLRDLSELTIKIKLKTPQEVLGSVYNIAGYLQQQFTINTGEALQLHQLRISGFGVYIIKLRTSEKEYVRKILINQ